MDGGWLGFSSKIKQKLKLETKLQTTKFKNMIIKNKNRILQKLKSPFKNIIFKFGKNAFYVALSILIIFAQFTFPKIAKADTTLTNGQTITMGSTYTGNLTISSGTVTATATGTTAGTNSFTVTGTLTINSGATLVLVSYANTNDSNSSGVIINAANITNNGTISADGKGFAGSTDYTGGNGKGTGGGKSGFFGGGGGSYGGKGGKGYDGATGPGTEDGGATYGSSSQPTYLGSGGGSGNTGIVAGSGGGAIKLIVSGTLTNDGTISTNGSSGAGSCGSNNGSGGGSGGSLWVAANILTSTISSGIFSANGGDGASVNCYISGGAGGGGRIHLNTTATDSYLGSITVSGGKGHQGGDAGSVLRDTPTNPVNITIPASSTVTWTRGDFHFNNLTIPSTSTITTGAAVGSSWGYYSDRGVGLGAGYSGTWSGSGGGHASAGGKGYDTSTGGPAYDSDLLQTTQPTDLGSSGGGSNNGSGSSGSTSGSGGGALKLTLDGTLTNNGTISVDGGNANGNAVQGGPGGGSGGSLWVIANTLSGNGSFSGKGGNTTGTSTNGGGGSGGRMAFSYTSLSSFNPSSVVVTGGVGCTVTCGGNSPTSGGVGTVSGLLPIISIGSPSASITTNSSVTYTISYSTASSVTLANGDITLNKTGTANGIVAVSSSGTTTRTVTISSITGDGTLGISIAANTASGAYGGSAAAAGPSSTFTVDNTAPTLSSVNLASNNTNTSYSKVGDVVTLHFTSSETIGTPTVVFKTGTVTVAGANTPTSSGNVWTASYTTNSADTAGTTTYTINFSDLAGNAGTAVTSGSGSVTFDKTSPSSTISPICVSGNTNGNSCTSDGLASLPIQQAYSVKSLTGTSNANDSNGFGSVKISIQNDGLSLSPVAGNWYDGSSGFNSGTENYITATGTTSWSYNNSSIPFLPGYRYILHVKGTDIAGNVENIGSNETLTFDVINSAPTVTSVSASEGSDGNVTVSYNVTDNESAQTTNYLFYDVGATLSGSISTTVGVSDSTNFPSSGTILIDNEMISYSGKSGNTLTGLTRGALNTTSVTHTAGAQIFIKAVAVSGTGAGISNIGNGKNITWTARTDVSYETASETIKVVANDGASGNMIGSLTSPSFAFDSKAPVISVGNFYVDASVNNTNVVGIKLTSTDFSNIKYRLCNNADFSADGLNSGAGACTTWSSLSSSISLTPSTNLWNVANVNVTQNIYLQVQDVYGNLTSKTANIPTVPASLVLKDVSNVQATPAKYREYVDWGTADVNNFSSYEIWSSTSVNPTYTLLGTITDRTNSSYTDTITTDTSATHNYKIRTIGVNGDISNFSIPLSDIPNGTGGTNVDASAPVITLNGANPMSVTLGGTYTEPGATATDAIDGTRAVLVAGTVNTNALGTYTITYTSSDNSGNIATATRTVNVVLEATYDITATAGAHGFISPSGTTSVASGGNQIYTITPNDGFKIATLTVDGTSLATASSYTFSNVTTTHTISATFSDSSAPVITLNGANPMSVTLGGTYTEPGATAVDNLDATATVTISGTVNTNALGAYTITYTSTDTAGNTATSTRTVNVVYANTYSIVATQVVHGTISPSGTTQVPSGTNQTYTITPDTGFGINSVIVDGQSLTPISSYTFTNVIATHTITATYKDITAPVITLNGANPMSVTLGGTYTEPGATAVDNLDVTATVTISGTVNTSALGAYTITYTSTDTAGNTRNATRTVNVVLDSTYNITATAGEHGSITPSGITAVTAGSNQMYAIVPDDNYSVDVLTIDGVNLAPVTSYTFMNVKATHTINVTFTMLDKTPPVITLNGDNPMNLVIGTTYTEPGATATDAIDGSRTVLISGTVNTGAVGSYNVTYTASDLSGNFATAIRTVHINLASTYNITASAGEHGSINPSGVTAVVSAGSQTYTITPDSGYSVDTLIVDGTNLASALTHTFSNVTTTHTISVTFTASPDTVPPVITILGDNPYNVILGNNFTDSGATALDDRDGDLTTSIQASGTVNTNAIKNYTITYTVSDKAKNTSKATRSVVVKYADTYDIVSSVSGSHGTISPLGTTHVSSTTDQTYTITPDEKYKVSSLIVDGKAVASDTTYTFSTVVSAHTIAVTFAPIDSLPPIITLNGDNPMSINVGNTFRDPGVTAVTAVAGEGEPITVIANGVINTTVASTGNIITYIATDSNGNIATAARTVNVIDTNPPVITDIAVPVKTETAAAITWTTNKPATSQVSYGVESGKLDHTTILDSGKSIYHVVTLSSGTNDTEGNPNTLTADTTYYFTVSSTDISGNNAVSTPESTFSTVPSVASTTTVVVVNNNTNNNPVNNNTSTFTPDTTPPVISGIKIDGITAFGATITFTTDKDTLSFAEYGKDIKYGDTSADSVWGKNHTINLRGLTLGTDYHVKISAVDKSGNATSSDDQTFKTKFFSENPSDLTKVDNVEQFQKEIESTIESILPALIPPFIEEPKVEDVTENSATISFRTNIKSFPVAGYVEDSLFDATKKEPYVNETSDTTEKTLDHQLILLNLKSNTKYRLQAKAFSLPQVVGKSQEITFTTKASKIQGSIIAKTTDSFVVVWNTDEPTSSIVQYKNLKSGEKSSVVDNSNKNKSHSVKIENLTPGTSYEVKISGINDQGNVVEGNKLLTVTTLVDVTPPVIASVKVDSSLVVGRTDRVQTIISWATDEPSTSTAYYEEGPGSPTKPLANKQTDLELTKNHVVVLTSMKPGTVYRFTVESKDSAGNITKPPIRTIITPKKAESIMDIMFKNFDDTFNFIQNVK